VKSIAVIGAPAAAFATGGGSSSVMPYSAVSPLAGITARAGPGAQVRYDDGSNPARAAAHASSADVAIVVAANYETEGADRQCLSLECPGTYGNQDSLIEQVAAANPRTIVVLETGGPVLTPWRDKVAAILEGWYPGEEGGAAIAGAVFGDLDPSGRLPVTFPRSYADEPTAGDPESYPGVAENETYNEGVFVGYRWFDTHGEQPAFPFGFGLSYTSFGYHGLGMRPASNSSLGATVTAQVTNTGRRAGAEVAQLYLGLPSLPGVPQPPSQLKGFQKVSLGPGRTAEVSFPLDLRSLAYWDTAARGWKVAPGCYKVMVGRSSRDLSLDGTVAVEGAHCSDTIARIPSAR
jgi:beta-glucosidase